MPTDDGQSVLSILQIPSHPLPCGRDLSLCITLSSVVPLYCHRTRSLRADYDLTSRHKPPMLLRVKDAGELRNQLFRRYTSCTPAGMAQQQGRHGAHTALPCLDCSTAVKATIAPSHRPACHTPARLAGKAALLAASSVELVTLTGNGSLQMLEVRN